MPSLNKVLLIGNLGKDPEMRYAPSGTAVCNFSMATTERFTKDGEKKQETEWHDITVFGKSAEFAGQYFAKGMAVLVEGRIKTNPWETNEGEKKSRKVIIADRVQGMGPNKEKEKEANEDDVPF